ncbi:recombinase family protein [Paenibacillus sp. YN15]|uniref:recombinase family protein n=1 Tax=Paenibacillus sp. YN15 TaxID=1742774 RepID=UPI000DCD6D46|nr:recombinase family protein [Paenibacillus sp. YN15]RAV02722.1 recombinase family protein [Paenibacillus sp. YN15]
MKVAVYVRVSSEHQAEKELSIPAQMKAIQQYCQERGHIIVNEFIEKGKSAKTDDRPEFQRMIAIAKRSSRPFEAILVHKFDRFSRNRDDHVIYKSLLAKCGVKVLSVTEQTEADTPQDKLLEGMLEIMSEFFNTNLATEVRKGMTQNAKQGYNNGGTPPYGYRTEHVALGNQKTKAVWVHGPREELDIIRWIFNQYAYENVGYKKISDILNEKNVPTQKGGQWSASTIRAIIYNEAYIGRRCWNKQEYQTKGVKWRDRSEWIIAENAHPAIITKELFELCQSKAKERHNGGGQTHNPFRTKPHSPFWLRGMLFCDKCGSRLVGNSTSTTKVHGGQKYYLCGGYMRKGKAFCQYVGWRKETLETLVANKLRTFLIGLTINQQLQEELIRYQADQTQLVNVNELESEIQFLEKRIKQMELEVADGRGKAYYSDAINEMKAELQAKQTELHAANTLSNHSRDVSEHILVTLKEDIRRLLTVLDEESPNPQSLHELVPKFISNVIVHRETKIVQITLEIAHDKEVLYRKVIVADWPNK